MSVATSRSSGNLYGARLLLADMRATVAETEGTMISRLISEYHGGTLTWDKAIATIAEIAALRRLVAGLERDVREGEAARGQDKVYAA